MKDFFRRTLLDIPIRVIRRKRKNINSITIMSIMCCTEIEKRVNVDLFNRVVNRFRFADKVVESITKFL
jgi:hypothetical protein